VPLVRPRRVATQALDSSQSEHRMSNSPEPSENPYAAPDPSVNYARSDAVLAGEYGMVNQVTIVGILQIVLGAMELMMGALFVGMTFFFSFMFDEMQAQASSPPPPDVMFLGIQVYYGIAGGLVLIFSIIRIAAGIRSFWFKSRTLMLVSLIGGMVSTLTCYCAPFSVGLGIYGLVVILNSGVSKAYRMAAEGVPPEEIKKRFAASAFGPR